LLYYINQQNNKKKLKYQQERMNNIVKQYYLLYNNQKKANLNKQLDNLVKLYYSHYLYKFNKKYKVYIFEQQQIKINNVQRESTAINPLMTYNGCGDTLNNNVLITINDVNNSVYIGDVITNVNNKKYYKY
ncbi:MAG: hypothetical protein N2485_08695, partial [bacterium]|nr:hypothetical protein [bacterium]